jgi:Tfp pilus assembly protein PilF
VTPDELGSLRQESQDAAARARDDIAQGRLREAGPLLDAALKVDPKNPSAHYLRGVVQFRQEQLGPARKSFDTVNALAPGHAPTLNNLAVILWRQENYAGALRSYGLAMRAAGENDPAAEAVLNNVAEALHALPKQMRDDVPTKRVVQNFQRLEADMVSRKERRGQYRWGSAWVDAAQLEKLLAKEKEIDGRIKDMEKEFDDVQDRIEEVDRDIADTERALRRMELSTYVRDPVTGRTGRTVPPRAYYGLQRDLQELQKERAGLDSKVAGLRREAKRVQQELPVPRYAGVQRIIDVEGTPLMPAADPASPAPPKERNETPHAAAPPEAAAAPDQR